MEALMKGKRGLVMGVANDHSIAWGIARALAANGAELAFTYQGEAFGRRVRPLAESLGSRLMVPCDVEDVATVDEARKLACAALSADSCDDASQALSVSLTDLDPVAKAIVRRFAVAR
ncbi:MAG: SDR family oxidoreductase, partial [Rhizobiales bacterium]|nr:SDR family oxidoreductase [Hyphomicrobiales bacterium]